MSSPFPLRPSVDHETTARLVMELTGDATEAVFDALGSETARSMLAALKDDPATATETANRVDTSLQNVQYHLEKLREADLVAVVGTWYSSRGKEMTVYAPTLERLEFRFSEPADDRGVASEAATPVAPPAATFND